MNQTCSPARHHQFHRLNMNFINIIRPSTGHRITNRYVGLLRVKTRLNDYWFGFYCSFLPGAIAQVWFVGNLPVFC